MSYEKGSEVKTLRVARMLNGWLVTAEEDQNFSILRPDRSKVAETVDGLVAIVRDWAAKSEKEPA